MVVSRFQLASVIELPVMWGWVSSSGTCDPIVGRLVLACEVGELRRTATFYNLGINTAWKTGGMKHSANMNKLVPDLVPGVNVAGTKLAKSFGIAGGEVEAVYNKGSALMKTSFADEVNGITPSQKAGGNNYAGNFVFVRVNDSAYQERIGLRQFSLIASIVLSKGDKPWKFDNLYSKLQDIRKLKKWQLISLGRGYFQILLFSTEDRQKFGILTSSNTHESRKRHWHTLEICVGHLVAKYKSVIGNVPPKDGSHANEKENKAPSLNQVYKLKQVPLLSIKSTTPSVPTANTFEVLNTEITPTHIEDMVHQHDAALSSMTNINREMCIEVRPPAPDLVPRQVTSWADAFGGSEDELNDDDYANDIVEDEWPPLPGEGSSKPSNEFDGTPYVGQQSNTMVMVPFESFGALTAEQRNLNLVASQPSVSETTDRNL
ncbi:hypothetical protein FNV43_RR15497 [Rhamnella rubrinervis]|uniref:Uncharacterized protein n=1 Tax=Rhamnella rubrinervis TaxID=2594499 RepID=A0A8K0GXH0_9ROSA|nr:hypothetical protein FNV43_RR15497 [Rhamnella rubrinervis]